MKKIMDLKEGDLLKIKEASKFLIVSKRTLYNWHRKSVAGDNRFPRGAKLGGTLLFYKPHLIEHIEKSRKPARRHAMVFVNDDQPCVYFVQSKDTRRIKIGYSSCFFNRLSHLSTSSCSELDVLLAIPGSLATEHAFHKLFQKEHVRNEWFSPSWRLYRTIIRNRRKYVSRQVAY